MKKLTFESELKNAMEEIKIIINKTKKPALEPTDIV